MPGAAVGSAVAKRGQNNEPAATGSEDQVEQLEKLAKLKEEGILTEEEFQAKKKQILGL